MAGQETVVYFFGESIEKLGPKKYKISKGGFSTCVQPTPRWDLVADTVTLNVDHYTFLKQAVLRVKGVPMFYLPVLYYPTKKEDRATGFLIPAYGSSTLRGQSIHNAFFWAIDRSQDATVFHDWYSNTGQASAASTRYNWRRGRRDVQGLPAQRDTTPRRGPRQRRQAAPGFAQLRACAAPINFCRAICARERASTIFQHRDVADVEHNIYDISRNQRDFGGNVVGTFGRYSLNATIDHREHSLRRQELHAVRELAAHQRHAQ